MFDVPGMEGLFVYPESTTVLTILDGVIVDIQLTNGHYLMVEFQDAEQTFYDLHRTAVTFNLPRVEGSIDDIPDNTELDAGVSEL